MHVELVCRKCGKLLKIGWDAQDIPAKCPDCGAGLILTRTAVAEAEIIVRAKETSGRETWQDASGTQQTWPGPGDKPS